MRLEWIDDILAVLDSGSLSRAAERRFLTQSAFTRRVRLIEDSVGATLFDRRRKPITLMPGIEALEPELRNLSTQLRKLRIALKAAAGLSRGSLSIACQHAITTTVSPWIVRALTSDDGASVRVRSGNRDECLMLLLSRDVDFAVMYELPGARGPLDIQALDVVPLGTDLLMPVCIPSMEAVSRSGQFPVISYPSDVFLGQIFDRMIAPNFSENVSVVTKAETALTLAAYQFALRGIGIAWLPQSIVQNSLDRGELIQLDDVLPSQLLEIRMIRLSEGQSDQSNALWRDLCAALAASAELKRLPDELAGFVQAVQRTEK